MKIVSSKMCGSCIALKGFLEGNLPKEQWERIELVDVEDFGHDKLVELGIMRLPAIILNDGTGVGFTNIIETSEFVKAKLEEEK